ncbi:MAG: T9SS type A sorting domain-containing protein [Flavobacteriales bacterium]|nr:T9SS type A sorting domain-containing protein [Flavobacteriales bacterium]
MKFSTLLFSLAISLLSLDLHAQADECADANVIIVTSDCIGSLATYQAGAATESQPALVCNTLGSPQANDLWFSFTAVGSATAVQVEGTGSFDPVVEGFIGTCGTLVSVGCADATYPMGDPPQNSTEILYMATDLGETYYVRVYSYWEPVPVDLDFSLCIYEVNDPPANDLCTSAVALPLLPGTPLILSGDDTGALDTEDLGLPSVWHAFSIGACTNVAIDLCGTAPARMAPFTGLFADCTLGTRVDSTSTDHDVCTDGNTTVLFENLPAGTYYYPVLQDGVGGTYTVTISSTTPTVYCTTTTVECDEYIARVVLGGIDNSTDCTQGVSADHTAISTGIERTQSLPIVVYNGPISYGEDSVAVWVDWDQDLGFCGLNERFALTSADDGITYMGNITAPADAVLGTTRMRIRMVYSLTPQACGASDFGEVEDYSLLVSDVTGIKEAQEVKWALFPNPSDGDFTVRNSGFNGKVGIELLDAMGRMVHQEQRTSMSGSPLQVNGASLLSRGVYLVRITSAQGTWTQRLVIR